MIRRCILIWLFLIAALTLSSQAMAGCTVTPTVSGNLGSASAPSVQKPAVPAVRVDAGATCSGALLTLLGGNYIRATVTSANGFVMQPTSGTARIAYDASADPNGTYRFNGGATVNYADATLLGLLGLGGTSVTLPIFVRPTGGTALVSGTYRDTMTIAWSWHSCDSISLAGLCVGRSDGSGETKLTVILVVAPRPLELVGTVVTVEDPVNGTNGPKAVPGGSVEQTVQVYNPDLVATDAGVLALVVPVPARTSLLLTDRGTGSGPVGTQEGSPASGLAVRFDTFASTTDDLDFSRDGTVWTHVPVPDAQGVDATVTHVRIRPRGPMPAGSRYAVTLRYRIN